VSLSLTDLETLPPAAVDMEMACLGAALASTSAAERVLEKVQPEDWYHGPHRLIQVALASLAAQDQAMDLASVGFELQRLGTLESVGGFAYLNTLSESFVTAAHIETYLKPVRETAKRRRLLAAARALSAAAHDLERDLKDVAGEAEAAIYRATADGREAGEWATAAEVVQRIFPVLAGEAPPVCYPSGYRGLDWFLNGGWKPQRLYIVAGRPGMAKTGAACNSALRLAKAGVPTGIISLEMGAEDLGFRLLAAESGIACGALESGELPGADQARALRYSGSLGDLPLYIWEWPSQTLAQVRSHARRLTRRYGVKVLFIDYLQLIEPAKGDADVRHYTAVAQGLKNLAKELDLPIIALSQLNRGVEGRDNKRPLRESGGLEQAADAVVMLYREAYYKRQEGEVIAGPDETEFIFAKNRGRMGACKLWFTPECVRFDNEPGPEDAEVPPPAYGDARAGYE
jgi:replicative DNA helicase